MASAYKLKKYPLEKSKSDTSLKQKSGSQSNDKALINQLNQKIAQLVEDPALQRKAADILSQMINSKK